MNQLVHVAIIMDGNGRWARARGLPRVAGHRKGVEAVRRTVRWAGENDIRYLTLFSFSAENWSRPETEVKELMGLLRFYLRSELAELHRNGVRLRIIGDRSRLDTDIRHLIEHGESLTSANDGLTLVVAISYGGRQDIVQAARTLATDIRTGRLDANSVDESLFGSYLWSADIPDPDLLIRTSGEKRISNFLLWQSAYAELVFVDTLWPDFTEQDLEAAVREFQSRERRYGGSVGSC